MLLLVSAFLAGVALVIVVEVFIVYRWFRSLPNEEPKLFPVHKPVTNPKDIAEYCGIEGATESETCMFLNLTFQFLWKEWRDSPKTRNFFIRKMNLEFQEMLLNKAAGKLMEQITVSDYYLGDSLPVIKKATIMKIDARNSSQVPREIDIAVDIEYSGGFIISLDVDLIFGKSAHFTVKLNSLVGRLRLQFTRNPCTHWSFSFYEDPLMDIKVESNFQGKNLPKLTSFIHNQIRRSVKKKHTFPRYKVRYKPFFLQEKPQDGKNEVFVHNSLVTVGKLDVEIVECTRIPQLPKGSHIYCSLSLDSLPWKEDMPMRRSLWPVHEVLICRALSGAIGISFDRGFEMVDEEKREVIYIKTVNPNSPASQVDIQRGDILISVNNVDVTSIKQAGRLVKNAGNKFTFKLQRPPPDSEKEVSAAASIVEDQEDANNKKQSYDEAENGFDDNSIALHEEDSENEEFVNIFLDEIEKELMDDAKTRKFVHDYKEMKRKSMIDQNDTAIFSTEDSASNPGSSSSVSEENEYKLVENKNCRNSFTEDVAEKKPPRRTKSFPFKFMRNKSKVTKSVSNNMLNKKSNNASETKLLSSLKHPLENNDNVVNKKKHVTLADVNETFDVSTDEINFTFDEKKEALGVFDSTEISASLHSADGEWDNISHNNFEPGTERVLETEEEVTGQRTSLASANQEPVWNEIFSFDVEKEQKFLNICVWGRCEMAFEKDALLGYVSIPLMELAVECLSTSGRKSIQTFFLAATANRIAVNRAYLRTMMPGLNLGCCNGDITLAYKYITAVPEAELESEEMKLLEEQLEKKEIDKEAKELEERDKTDEKPHLHNFIGTEFYFPTRCDYCQNKVWRKVAFQCGVCAMVCHKRCIDNAQANTYCTSHGVRAKPPIWQKNGAVPRANEDQEYDEEASKLQEQSTSPRPYSVKVPTLHDLRPGMKNSGRASPNILQRRKKMTRRVSLDDIIKQDKSCNSIPEDIEDAGLDDSITTAAVTAKEAGRELFASLDEDDRQSNIQTKVDELQIEVTAESVKQTELRKRIVLCDNMELQQKLQSLLRKSEERGQALALLMIQYCAALNECLTANESQQCDL
ncbi:PDZ domain-containing protein 8-like isoform X1 [Hydractinia symbiolongicarpus]|uniref:PDZ domain-containing protein 8-like isoform X1 n=1 Tax=Hydractinia symbiolongicarpus TaxID=13093 RepID=UPI00254DD04A|nr:PDZ domain-containing protein 8-like isoform X1 [Hydractinia symbiolongicarpus]